MHSFRPRSTHQRTRTKSRILLVMVMPRCTWHAALIILTRDALAIRMKRPNHMAMAGSSLSIHKICVCSVYPAWSNQRAMTSPRCPWRRWFRSTSNKQCDGFVMDRVCAFVPCASGNGKLRQIKYWAVDKFHALKHKKTCKHNILQVRRLANRFKKTKTSACEQVFSWFRNYARLLNEARPWCHAFSSLFCKAAQRSDWSEAGSPPEPIPAHCQAEAAQLRLQQDSGRESLEEIHEEASRPGGQGSHDRHISKMVAWFCSAVGHARLALHLPFILLSCDPAPAKSQNLAAQ